MRSREAFKTFKGGTQNLKNKPLAQTVTDMNKTFEKGSVMVNRGGSLFEGNKVKDMLSALQGTLDSRGLTKAPKLNKNKGSKQMRLQEL